MCVSSNQRSETGETVGDASSILGIAADSQITAVVHRSREFT